MTDIETRKCTVFGYTSFRERQFQEDGQLATRTQLQLKIRQNEGPPDRPVTMALITFGRHAEEEDAHAIGKIARQPAPHAAEFQLVVTLPAADFDHYWSVLHTDGQPHLRCRIPPHSDDIEEFTLVSGLFPVEPLST